MTPHERSLFNSKHHFFELQGEGNDNEEGIQQVFPSEKMDTSLIFTQCLNPKSLKIIDTDGQREASQPRCSALR